MKPGGRIAPGAGGGLDAVKYRSSVCFPYINGATGGRSQVAVEGLRLAW